MRKPIAPTACDSNKSLSARTFDGLEITKEERSNVNAAIASGKTDGLTMRELRAFARSIRWQ